MKRRVINENPDWEFYLPDSIADWDAPSHWERERLASMQQHLRPGMTLFDVGTEHGWLTALYGSWVGHENCVLIEPGDEMWRNIRLTWEANRFKAPLACWHGFVSDSTVEPLPDLPSDWPVAAMTSNEEIGAMAYKYLFAHDDIPTITIDILGSLVGRKVDAITMDIEGAELKALHGAKNTLLNDRPLLWVSVHPDLMARDFGIVDEYELFRFVESCGYRTEYLGTDHEQHYFFTPL